MDNAGQTNGTAVAMGETIDTQMILIVEADLVATAVIDILALIIVVPCVAMTS